MHSLIVHVYAISELKFTCSQTLNVAYRIKVFHFLMVIVVFLFLIIIIIPPPLFFCPQNISEMTWEIFLKLSGMIENLIISVSLFSVPRQKACHVEISETVEDLNIQTLWNDRPLLVDVFNLLFCFVCHHFQLSPEVLQIFFFNVFNLFYIEWIY